MAERSKPKETREFNGKQYLLEESFFADYAFIKVHKADKLGNCQFRKAMNNFNEAMAKNAKITFVEADNLVEVGEIAPENVHLQGIYVSKVIQSTEEKKIEKLTFAKDPSVMLKAGERLPSFPVRSSSVAKFTSKQALETQPQGENASLSEPLENSRTGCT